MRRKRWTRLRACGRWGVWVCTASTIALIYVSNYQKLRSPYSLIFLGSGFVEVGEFRLNLIFSRPLSRSFVDSPIPPAKPVVEEVFGPQFESPIQFGYCGTGLILANPPTPWWVAPRLSTERTTVSSFPVASYEVDIPLVYVVFITAPWSLWLFIVNQRYRLRKKRWLAGCCVFCGYSLEGLSSGVCPECGSSECGEKYA